MALALSDAALRGSFATQHECPSRGPLHFEVSAAFRSRIIPLFPQSATAFTPTSSLASKPARCVKYAALALLVVLLPYLRGFEASTGLRLYYCKICPEGMLTATLPSLFGSTAAEVYTVAGGLASPFTILLFLLALMVLVWRGFCRATVAPSADSCGRPARWRDVSRQRSVAERIFQ